MNKTIKLEPAICPQCGAQIEVNPNLEEGFCNYCGTKIIIKDVIQKVKVSGKVQIDNSEFVQKQLVNARRAISKEDWEEAERYYNLVEQYNPTNIEAIFYSSYSKAKQALIEDNFYKRQAAFQVLKNCVSIVDDNFSLESEEEDKKTVNRISDDILKMVSSDYIYNVRRNQYGAVIWNDRAQTITLFNNVQMEFMRSLEHIAAKYPEEKKQSRIYYYVLALQHGEYLLQHGSLSNPSGIINVVMYYHRVLHDLNPAHQIPDKPPRAVSGTNACYVATYVYGSYDCPEVWTLRRFRDYKLHKSVMGRAFIKTYYFISPKIIKIFKNNKTFKAVNKKIIDKWVARLNKRGYENTKYRDLY